MQEGLFKSVKKGNKLISIDYLKALSMLYIVGYFHFFEYQNISWNHVNFFTARLAPLAVGLFTIISGFLNGAGMNASESLVAFYRRRFLRIYPLYVLAVFLYYIFGIQDAATCLKTAIFISIIYGPSPHTLWYICMLILFYVGTPLLIKYVKNPLKFLLLVVAIEFVVTGLFLTVFKSAHRWIIFYFPFYCLGIYCSQHGFSSKGINIRSAFLVLFLGLILPFVPGSEKLIYFKWLPLTLSCSFLILALSCMNDEKFKKIGIISCISYSSYAMFLFHRPIFVFLKALYFPKTGIFQVLYLWVLGVPAVIIISWGLQKLYDLSYTRISRKSSGS